MGLMGYTMIAAETNQHRRDLIRSEVVLGSGLGETVAHRVIYQ